MNKIVILVILVLLVAGIVYFATAPKQGVKSEQDAKTFMVEYLTQKFPQGDIEVLSIEKKEGSYQIKTRVSFGITGKCPERYHYISTYPETGITSEAFVLPPAETIVGKSCVICQGKTKCLISFDEEAVKLVAQKSEGDFRSALLDLQSLSFGGKISVESVGSFGERMRTEKIFKVMSKIFKGKTF